jgi:cbb3-type cytochrome oxidase subunit 1
MGGVLFLTGALIMTYNLWKTAVGAGESASTQAVPAE